MKNIDVESVREIKSKYEKNKQKENKVFVLIFIIGFVLLVASIWLFTE